MSFAYQDEYIMLELGGDARTEDRHVTVARYPINARVITRLEERLR